MGHCLSERPSLTQEGASTLADLPVRLRRASPSAVNWPMRMARAYEGLRLVDDLGHPVALLDFEVQPAQLQ